MITNNTELKSKVHENNSTESTLTKQPIAMHGTKQQIKLEQIYVKQQQCSLSRRPWEIEGSWTPQYQVNINLQHSPLKQENKYEIALALSITVKQNSLAYYEAHVVQAGVFVCEEKDKMKLEELFFIDAAMQLYPYAIRVLTSLSQDAGYAGLRTEPMDFVAMYEQYKKQNHTEEKTNSVIN